jgi:sugar phosphate permease
MSDGPLGPYAPTWTNRRRVVFGVLGFCLPAIVAVAFFAPDTAPASTVAWALGGVIMTTLGFYLYGPSLEAAQLTRWMQK